MEIPGHSSSTSAGEKDPLGIILRLRSIARELFLQLELHWQLFNVEWTEERNRLLQLFATTLIGFAFLLCSMIFFGILIVAISWPTNYRVVTISLLVILYGLGFLASLVRIKRISAQRVAAFAATQAELSADLALLRSKL